MTTSPRPARVRASDPAGRSDAALLSAVARGDEGACRSFVERHASAVFGLALGMCRDRGTAEDVAQRAFERAWRHAGSFEPARASARTWLLVITRRLAVDELRRRRAVPLAPIDLDVLLDPAGGGLESVALAEVERTAITGALSELPEAQRRAVVLAALAGRTAAEVAEIEGVPLGTAKTRIRLGLRRLRAELDGEVDRG